MTIKELYSIELNTTQYEVLEEMVKKYELVDVGKAMRCLVNYVREDPGKGDEVFDQIRCLDC